MSDRKPYIVFFVDTWTGVAWYRCHTPGHALQKAGYEVLMTDQIDDWVEHCDVAVLERMFGPQAQQLVRYLNSRGVRTVFDIDDDYWTLHPENPAYAFWNVERLEGLEDVARNASLITTTTAELVDTLKKLNSQVKILGNMLPEEYWPTTAKRLPRAGEPLVIGWAGSPSHLPDLRMVAPALRQILDDYPHVELHLCGPADWFDDHPRVRILKTVQVDEYASVLSGFDIGIAPVLDNRFNRCKSDLKFLEYAMVGLPVVSSKIAPYERSIRHGENGLLAQNAKDWIKHLRHLVENADLRDRLGANARAFAENRTISANIGKWEHAYGLDGSAG